MYPEMSAIRKQAGWAAESMRPTIGRTDTAPGASSGSAHDYSWRRGDLRPGRSGRAHRHQRWSSSVRFCELGILLARCRRPVHAGPPPPRRAGQGARGLRYPARGLGEAVRCGQLWLDFLDAPAFERFSALGGDTFAQLAQRSKVPIELLLLIREAAGSAAAGPDDRVRDEELALRRSHPGTIPRRVPARRDPAESPRPG